MDNENSAIFDDVKALLGNLPKERNQLVPLLWRVAEHQGRISKSAMEAVAALLDVPVADVFGVASFYTLFEDLREDLREGVPAYICSDVMCALKDSQKLKEAAEAAATDRKVMVKESACLGQCDYAPAAWIGGKILREASCEQVQTAVREVPYD